MATTVTSIEPGRRKAYSVEVTVATSLALGLRYHEIATNLGISVGTAYNTIELLKATGDVSPKTGCKRRERSLDSYHERFIIVLVLQ